MRDNALQDLRNMQAQNAPDTALNDLRSMQSQNQKSSRYKPSSQGSLGQHVLQGVEQTAQLPFSLGQMALGNLGEELMHPSDIPGDIYGGARAEIQNKLLPLLKKGLMSESSGMLGRAQKQGVVSPQEVQQAQQSQIPGYTPARPDDPQTRSAEMLFGMLPAAAAGGVAELGAGALMDLAPAAEEGVAPTMAQRALSLARSPAKIATGGVAAGLTQGQNPVTSAVQALTTGGLARAMGIGAAPQGAMRNMALKAAQETAQVAPEDVGANLAQQHIQPGEPVGLGTAVGSPKLQGLQDWLEGTPLTGGKALINKVRENQSNHISNIIDNNNATNSALEDSKASLENALNTHSNAIDSYKSNLNSSNLPVDEEGNQVVNSLAANTPQGVTVASNMQDGIKDAYDKNHAEAKELYDQLAPKTPAGDIRLDKLAGSNENFLPNYKKAAKNLDVNNINLEDVWGKPHAKSTAGKIISEVKDANNINVNKPLTVSEAIDKIQHLSELSRAAYQANDGKTGIAIGAMRDGLSKDLDGSLRNNGYSNEADILQNANSIWKNKVTPFTSTPSMRKLVRNGTRNALPVSKELLHINNNDLARLVPRSTSDESIHTIIHGGSAPTNNISNYLGSDVSGAYNGNVKSGKGGLSTEYKESIRNLNPTLGGYLENLPQRIRDESLQKQSVLNNADNIKTQLKNQNKLDLTSIENQQSDLKNSTNGLKKELDALKNPKSEDIAKNWGKAAKFARDIGSMAITPYSRALTSALYDPKVLDAYLKGESPSKFSVVPQGITKASPLITATGMAVNQNEGNQ